MRLILVPTLWVALASVLLANPTATLSGRVTNRQGQVLSEVQVTATQIETNQRFRTRTNRLGLYRLPNLPPGQYRVIIRLLGYRTIVKPDLELHVQDAVVLNFSMQVGSVIASVTELGGIPLIRTESATLGTTIRPQVMTELPSLTRNPYDFVGVSSGATPASVRRGIGFALNGQRAESGGFLLDGSANNEPYNSGPGQIVPLDAVQEYRLLTNNFTAEYGRNAGFIANVITKSGVNEFHGNAYYFRRNSGLAANTFENNSRGLPRPVFNRQQLGGTLGGPVYRDKVFFFAAVEPIVVRSSAALSYYVPTPQLLSVSSPGTNAIFDRFPLPSNLSETDISTRTVCPFGRACGSKIGAGFVTLPALASTSRTGPVDAGAGPPQDTYLWTARIDTSIGPRTVLNTRYAFQDHARLATVDQPYSSLLDRSFHLRNQTMTVNLTRFWTGNFLTESRLVFNRLFQQRAIRLSEGFPSFVITGDEISGAVGSLALPSGRNGDGGAQNEYQFQQMANWVRGRHNLKFGASLVHLRDNQTPAESTLTRHNHVEFRDLQRFVDGRVSSFQIHLDPRGKVPGELLPPPFGSFNPRRHYRFNDWACFLQDSWKVSPRLTLSPGVRYEYFGSGHRIGQEKRLEASFYRGEGTTSLEQMANGRLLRTADAPGHYRNHFFPPSKTNISPRMGLAYDLTGRGRLVFRAGIGRFYERLPGFVYENVNPPAFSVVRISGVPLAPALFEDPYSLFPSRPLSLPPSAISHLDQDLTTASTWAWNATLQQDWDNKLLLAASYVGSNGQDLYRPVNANRLGSGRFLGRPGERLVNHVAALITVGNQARSSYHGMQLRIDSLRLRRFGLQYGLNYTWSHSLDNVSSLAGDDSLTGGAGLPLDAFDPDLDKGPSDHDVRHRMVGHFVWQIPGAARTRGLTRLFLAGWQFSGIVSFQSGQPFSLWDGRVFDRELSDNTRPRLTGQAPALLGTGERQVDVRTPNAFLILPINRVRNSNGSCIAEAAPFACQLSVNGPFDGSLGRNTFRRPGTHFQNVALAKNIDLPEVGGVEGLKLQFRAEFYNLFNHSNLYVKPATTNVAASSFNTDLGSRAPGVVASFGTPAGFPQEARQIVLAAKLIF